MIEGSNSRSSPGAEKDDAVKALKTRSRRAGLRAAGNTEGKRTSLINIPASTRRIIAAAGLILTAGTQPSFAQTPPRHSGEFVLSLGAGFSSAAGESLHRASWTTGPQAGMSVENVFTVLPSPALFVGGAYSRFFQGSLGLRAGFGYLKSPLNARTTFRWTAGSTFPWHRLSVIPDPGEITAVPFFVNIAARWDGRRSVLVLSAGPAVILHSIIVETAAGTLSAPSGWPAAYRVSAAVKDQTWIALGANAGAEIDLRIGKSSFLSFDVRYFYTPRKQFAWIYRAGTAPGIDIPSASAPFDEAAARKAETATSPLPLDPSFFQASIGFKFRLGST